MAWARLALTRLQHRAISSPSSASTGGRGIPATRESRWAEVSRRFATATSEGREESVPQARKTKPSPRKQRRRWLWRNGDRDFVPALPDFFPSGLGHALLQATENVNKLFEHVNFSPLSLRGRVSEKDDCYRLRLDMPGLAKDEVQVTVEDGVLRVKGEHRDEKKDEEEDEYWSSRSYGYYDTSLVLPEDAKAEKIQAELKDGVLSVTIPRTEKTKEVQEVKVA